MLNTLRDINVSGKKVLVRVDFNVPVDSKGLIIEDARIRGAIPTIRYLIEKDCKIIVMSHFGRPKGNFIESLRMDGIARQLSQLLNAKVTKLDDCIGSEVRSAAGSMQNREILLLENLRFYEGEEKNDEVFAQELASLAEIYVNDAFGASHREHASVDAITKFLPSCAGFLLEKEIMTLGKLMKNPERPFVAVLGGAKISDKLKLIENLLNKVDRVLIGGAMAFTLLKAEGFEVGKSKIEGSFIGEAKKLLSDKVVLPVDAAVADGFYSGAKARIVSLKEMGNNYGLDIGPQTVRLFQKYLSQAKTVVWNGPMGVFEFENFSNGTVEIAKCISALNVTTIIGGGDTIASSRKAGVAGKFSHVSTGGGAMLKFMEGSHMPAIAALTRSE